MRPILTCGNKYEPGTSGSICMNSHVFMKLRGYDESFYGSGLEEGPKG